MIKDKKIIFFTILIVFFLLFSFRYTLYDKIFTVIYKDQIYSVLVYVHALHFNDKSALSESSTSDSIFSNNDLISLMKKVNVSTMKVMGVRRDRDKSNVIYVTVYFDDERIKSLSFKIVKQDKFWLIDTISVSEGLALFSGYPIKN